MKQKFNLIQAAILDAHYHEQWRFPNPITVRLSDRDYDVLEIYGICVSPKKELYLMTFTGYPVTMVAKAFTAIEQMEQWHKLDLDDINADKVLDAVYEKVIPIIKKGAAA